MNTYYVLDNHRHIIVCETQIEATLDLMQGLPPGWVIVDDNDKPVTIGMLIH